MANLAKIATARGCRAVRGIFFRERAEIRPGTCLFDDVLNFCQRRFGLLVCGSGWKRNQDVTGATLLRNYVSAASSA